MGVFNYLKKMAAGTAKAANWRQSSGLGSDQLDDFITFGEWLNVSSSNVVAAQYDAENEQMTVEFGADTGGGQFYLYYQISEAEARDFALSSSPGGWCWDNLRIRGTVDGHRKPFVHLSGISR